MTPISSRTKTLILKYVPIALLSFTILTAVAMVVILGGAKLFIKQPALLFAVLWPVFLILILFFFMRGFADEVAVGSDGLVISRFGSQVTLDYSQVAEVVMIRGSRGAMRFDITFREDVGFGPKVSFLPTIAFRELAKPSLSGEDLRQIAEKITSLPIPEKP